MITYAVVGVVIARILNTFIEWYIEEDVKTGNIVMMLTKPLNYVWYNAAISLGEYSDAFIRTALPSFIICILIFHIFVPDPLTLILAFISVFLGAAVLFLISFILGTFAFWTTGSIWFLRSLKQTSITLLSGSFIPLAFFPELLRNIADVLPFQTIYHVPLSIYLGKISGFAMLQAFAIQIFWIVLLAVIATLTWKAARRRFVALGG
jgi:ABC-2 type transport system permease protein